MEPMKFKTTIKCEGCVAKVTPFLDAAVGKGNWGVEIANPSKVLTINSQQTDSTIIQAVEKAGFKAEKI